MWCRRPLPGLERVGELRRRCRSGADSIAAARRRLQQHNAIPPQAFSRKSHRVRRADLTQSDGVDNDFSDPAWWPTPPPKPPRKISTTAIVFGTFVPIAVIVIRDRRDRRPQEAGQGWWHRPVAGRLRGLHAGRGGNVPDGAPNSRFLEQDAAGVPPHLPRGMALPSFTAPSGADQESQRAFAECVQAATANISSQPPRRAVRRRLGTAGVPERGRDLPIARGDRPRGPGGTPPPPAPTTTAPAVA